MVYLNRTLYLFQIWNIDSITWNNDYHVLYSYNEQGLRVLYIRQTWNIETGQWMNNSKSENYWSDILVSDVLEDNQSLVTVHPNPSKGLIKIITSINQTIEICIFDIHGRNLFSKEITETNNQIDLSHLQKGIYFIQVNGEETHKIILK